MFFFYSSSLILFYLISQQLIVDYYPLTTLHTWLSLLLFQLTPVCYVSFLFSLQISRRTTTCGTRAVSKSAIRRPASLSPKMLCARGSLSTTTTTPSVRTCCLAMPHGEAAPAACCTIRHPTWGKTGILTSCWRSASSPRCRMDALQPLKNSGSISLSSAAWPGNDPSGPPGSGYWDTNGFVHSLGGTAVVTEQRRKITASSEIFLTFQPADFKKLRFKWKHEGWMMSSILDGKKKTLFLTLVQIHAWRRKSAESMETCQSFNLSVSSESSSLSEVCPSLRLDCLKGDAAANLLSSTELLCVMWPDVMWACSERQWSTQQLRRNPSPGLFVTKSQDFQWSDVWQSSKVRV